MRGKQTRGRRKIQVLHDFANDGGFVALKRAAEDRQGWRHRRGFEKPAIQQKTTLMMNITDLRQVPGLPQFLFVFCL